MGRSEKPEEEGPDRWRGIARRKGPSWRAARWATAFPTLRDTPRGTRLDSPPDIPASDRSERRSRNRRTPVPAGRPDPSLDCDLDPRVPLYDPPLDRARSL